MKPIIYIDNESPFITEQYRNLDNKKAFDFVISEIDPPHLVKFKREARFKCLKLNPNEWLLYYVVGSEKNLKERGYIK